MFLLKGARTPQWLTEHILPANNPSRNHLDRSLPYSSTKAFEKVFVASGAGERIVYHIGHLSFDRGLESALTPSARKVLDAVARSVVVLEQEGRGDPLCRRLESGIFEYAMTKRRTKCDGVHWEGFEEEDPYKHQDKTPPPPEDPIKVKMRHPLPVPPGATLRQVHEIERSPFIRGAR